MDVENSVIYLASQFEFPNQCVEFDDKENHMFENQSTYDVMQEFCVRRDFNYMDSFIQQFCLTHDGKPVFVDTTNEEYEYKVELITYHPAWGIVEVHMVSMADRNSIKDEELKGAI
ncbi:MAG: hypothetical protein ACRCXT_17925 [Paraclostridium sp.]